MRYLLLIYGDAERTPSPETPAGQASTQAYVAYTADAQQAGVSRAAEALQPAFTATSVRVRDGKTLTTDGPFAETKEVLGGFYEVECASREEAIAWAARIPTVAYGTIEVRPLVEYGEGS